MMTCSHTYESPTIGKKRDGTIRLGLTFKTEFYDNSILTGQRSSKVTTVYSEKSNI